MPSAIAVRDRSCRKNCCKLRGGPPAPPEPDPGSKPPPPPPPSPPPPPALPPPALAPRPIDVGISDILAGREEPAAFEDVQCASVGAASIRGLQPRAAWGRTGAARPRRSTGAPRPAKSTAFIANRTVNAGPRRTGARGPPGGARGRGGPGARGPPGPARQGRGAQGPGTAFTYSGVTGPRAPAAGAAASHHLRQRSPNALPADRRRLAPASSHRWEAARLRVPPLPRATVPHSGHGGGGGPSTCGGAKRFHVWRVRRTIPAGHLGARDPSWVCIRKINSNPSALIF